MKIFLHIPKCGGTSIRKALIRAHPNSAAEIYNTVYNLKENSNHKDIVNSIKCISSDEKSKFEYLIGHRVYKDIHLDFNKSNAKYYTILRNPVFRSVSRYNYLVSLAVERADIRKNSRSVINPDGEIMRFYEWLKRKSNNDVIKFILHGFLGKQKTLGGITKEEYMLVLEELEDFNFVGILEYPEDLEKIKGILQLDSIEHENRSPKYFVPKDYGKLVAEVKKYNGYDMMLYDHFLKRRSENV